MSNLIKFNQSSEITPQFESNIKNLSSIFGSFSEGYSYEFTGISDLDLNLGIPVLILPSDNEQTSVLIDCKDEDIAKLQIIQHHSTLKIEQKGSINTQEREINFFGFKFKTSVQTLRYASINGTPVINTKDDMAKIIIKTPEHSGSLRATMSEISAILSTIPHKKADLRLSNLSQAGLAAENIDICHNGIGDSFLHVAGGDLNVLSESIGNISAFGQFQSVRATTGGIGNIKTYGPAVNYDAQSSGIGSIRHKGPISGTIRKNASGIGKINLNCG